MAQGSTGFLLKEGCRNFKENSMLSIASIGVLTACMLIIGVSLLISLNLSSIMGYIQGLNEVVVFLDDNVTEEQTNNVKSWLENNENINYVQYTSKDEALKTHIASLPTEEERKLFVELLGEENPLPALFNIKIENLRLLTELVNAIDNLDGVYYTRASTDLAETLIDIRTAVNFAGAVMITILVLVSAIIVNNTVKMTIFNRRREINIMKFVGASDIFIRIPFFVEGMITGLVSGTLSFLLTWGAYEYVFQWILSSKSSWLQLLSENLIMFSELILPFGLGFMCFGIGFGLLGSMFFVNKYLKV